LDNYVKETVNDMNIEIPIIYINNGVKGSKRGKVITMPQVIHNDIEMLLSEKDKVTYIINIPQEINAPVKNNTHIGEIIFYVNNIEIGRDEIYLVDDIEEYSYKWCLNRILDYFF
jgi:D-alanyl-D-alanine carboxypeptidase (penicillin-binding protein 5/6)